MASETTAANPELLQEQVANILIQPLEAASVVLSSGVRIFDTSGPLRIPKLTAGASVGFVAEGGLIPEADVDFGEIALMPSTLKSLKVLIRFTNELLRQSVIGLDATLRQRLVTDVSNALDTALLTGAGTSNTITGHHQPGRCADRRRWTSLTPTASSTPSPSHRPPRSPRIGGSSTADFIALRKLKDGLIALPAGVRRHRRPDLPAVWHSWHRHQQARRGQGYPGRHHADRRGP